MFYWSHYTRAVRMKLQNTTDLFYRLKSISVTFLFIDISLVKSIYDKALFTKSLNNSLIFQSNSKKQFWRLSKGTSMSLQSRDEEPWKKWSHPFLTTSEKSVIVWLSPHGRADNWKSKHSVEVQCFLCCPNRCDFVIVYNVCFGFKLFLQKGEEFWYISTAMIKLMNTEYNVHTFCFTKSAMN